MTRKRALLVTLLLLVWSQDGIGQNQKYYVYDTDLMKPAVFKARRKAIEVIQDGLLKLGIIKTKEEYSKFFIHGAGHPVGLSVHDVSGTGKLEPGMVWTVEPGIYIPEGSPGVDPKYYNIGVRIEDCVLVTEDGYRIMSASAPRTVDEIERLMKKRGIGNEPLE